MLNKKLLVMNPTLGLGLHLELLRRESSGAYGNVCLRFLCVSACRMQRIDRANVQRCVCGRTRGRTAECVRVRLFERV